MRSSSATSMTPEAAAAIHQTQRHDVAAQDKAAISIITPAPAGM